MLDVGKWAGSTDKATIIKKAMLDNVSSNATCWILALQYQSFCQRIKINLPNATPKAEAVIGDSHPVNQRVRAIALAMP